ncbi:MAG: spermidine synthase, partial [Deltaproteobacteria bacterium]|nr:spermidine synthase [Deltaproteobacteria bacterium]
MNVYSAILGPEGRFLRAVTAGFSRIFPLVHLFPVQFPDNARAVQNVLIVARKKGDVPFSPGTPDPFLTGYLAHRWPGPVPRDVPVLTDDKAPVARYLGK